MCHPIRIVDEQIGFPLHGRPVLLRKCTCLISDQIGFYPIHSQTLITTWYLWILWCISNTNEKKRKTKLIYLICRYHRKIHQDKRMCSSRWYNQEHICLHSYMAWTNIRLGKSIQRKTIRKKNNQGFKISDTTPRPVR